MDGYIPTPVQKIALESTADEVLFGGARGSGKTVTAMHWLLYDVHRPQFRALVIRRNATDLADFIERSRTLYVGYGATVSGNPATVKFPSGAIIYTGHLGTPDAYTKYQGWQLHRLLMEEATHIPSEKLYEKLLGSVRSVDADIPTQVFLTTNPGGPGAEWIKERFKIGNKAHRIKFIEKERTFVYIDSTIYDNPHLLKADPSYLKYLESLPAQLREQWLNGSWDDFDIEGAYYIKQMNSAEKDGRITIIPFETSLRTFTFWDLGISDAMSIWTMQLLGNELRMVDYYENTGEGLAHYINYLHDLRDRYNFTYTSHYAPHDIAVRELSTGVSREVTARKMGINFVKVKRSSSISSGIEAARNVIGRCWFDADRTKDGIRCLKNYRKEFDEKLNRFKDQPLHDWSSHGADAFRTFAVAFQQIRKDNRPAQTNQVEWSDYD